MLPGPRQTLFRAEALHEQRTLWLGRQTLSLGLPAASLSAMSTVLLIATALLVTFGSYARRETLHGVMLPQPGWSRSWPLQPDGSRRLHVKEGETVSPDTRLYTLNTDHTTKDGSAQQRVLQSLTAERALLRSQIERKTQITEQENAQLLKKMAESERYDPANASRRCTKGGIRPHLDERVRELHALHQAGDRQSQ